jgi:hypothetical protein
MSWNTLVKVVRYHLLGWTFYVAVPWVVLMIGFALSLAAATAKPAAPGQYYGSAVVFAIYLGFGITGLVGMLRSLPFAFSLGVSRRAYYAGTALLSTGWGWRHYRSSSGPPTAGRYACTTSRCPTSWPGRGTSPG